MSLGCDVVVSSVTAVGRGWEGGRRLSGVRSCGTARETGAREVIAEGWRRGMRRGKRGMRRGKRGSEKGNEKR